MSRRDRTGPDAVGQSAETNAIASTSTKAPSRSPATWTAALNEEPSGPGVRSNGTAGTIVAGMARAEMRERLNADLTLDPRRTAVLAIDTHRGHLDPEVATMPVAADVAADVVAASRRLL